MIGGIGLFICMECGELFEHPVEWVETHGFSTPPYEHWSGSPCCHGNYAETFKCDMCDEWIEGQYIKTNDGDRICDNCYETYDIGDE
jgi:formylmethanofuran dehydrogenase subunit E